MSLANLLKKGGLRKAANAIPADVAKHGRHRPSSLAKLALAIQPDRTATDLNQSPKNLGELTSHQDDELIAPGIAVECCLSLANLSKKDGLRKAANAIPADVAKHGRHSASTSASLAGANQSNRDATDPKQSPKRLGDLTFHQGNGLTTTVATDLDSHCCPHSDAMNSAEIRTFTTRAIRFIEKGVAPTDGEALAGKLMVRDRDADDRRLCLECTHLSGYAQTFGCRAWKRAGIAIKAQAAGLPVDLVRTLQRCDAFTHAI